MNWTQHQWESAAFYAGSAILFFGAVALIVRIFEAEPPPKNKLGVFVRSFAKSFATFALCWVFTAGMLIWSYGYDAMMAIDATQEIGLAAAFTVGLSLWNAIQDTFFPQAL